MACKDRLTIPRVPFSLNRPLSGVRVTVRTHNGREFSEPNVVVEDLLVVGFGDLFASGESNPDKPVTLQRRARDGVRPGEHTRSRIALG